MNKKEFTAYLEERLSVLNKNERDDIINEYVQHIDNKLEEGLTEKEAVETLGNVEDMVREILSAYNVDPDYKNNGESEINTVVTGVFSKFVNGIKGIGDFVLSHKASSLIKFVIKALILFFVLCICFEIGEGIAAFFGGVVGGAIGQWTLVRTFVKVVYVIIALPTVIYIFIKFLAFNIYGDRKSSDTESTEDYFKNTAVAIKRSIASRKNNKADCSDSAYSFENIIKKIWNLAVKLFFIGCRLFILMCLIPCVVTLFFTIVAFGGLLIFMIMGYPVIGATIGCFGFNLAGTAFIVFIIKLIFFNKKEVERNEEVL